MKQYQMVKATVNINSYVSKGTIGVILEILDSNTFIVEFFNAKNETIDDGMTTAKTTQLEIHLAAHHSS